MIRLESIDLFGERVVTEVSEAKRKVNCNGYASPPGSGPTGESCKTCEYAVGTGYHGKTYYKCELLKAHWTGGPGSDIRLKSPACKHWKAEAAKEKK